MEVHRNQTDPTFRFITKQVSYNQLAITFKKDDPVTIQTAPNSISAAATIAFQRGLVKFNNNGNREETTADFTLYYRKVGAVSWTRLDKQYVTGVPVSQPSSTVELYQKGVDEYVTIRKLDFRDRYFIRNGKKLTMGTAEADGIQRGSFREKTDTRDDYEAHYSILLITPTSDILTFTAATQNPLYVVATFNFPSPGQYELKITQKSDTSTDTRTQNEATLTMVQSYNNDKVLNLQRPHTFVETSIIASDQINGVIQNFSAIGTSVLRDFDKGGWNGKYVATRNPALIALDVLAGTENSSPLTDDQIDFVSWNSLKNHCDNQVTLTVGGKTETVTNHVCDVVVDTSQTVQELVNSILTTARAQLNIQQNGKFGVMIDDTKTVPRQLFTPANSWNFSGTRTFAEIPDALKVKFIDPGLGWQLNEQIVYYDGKNAGNARVFEDLETYGITDYIQAHRYGRYMMKSGVLRSELFSINVDVENLVVTRGDLVAVQHDVPKMGGMAFRIVEINGAVITLDHDFIAPANAGYTYRTIDGDVKTGVIVASTIDTITLQTADPDMGVDDLIVVGERDKVTRNYMVRGIAAGNDLTATLELVLYDDDVYTEGAIPEWDPGFGDDLLHGTDLEVFNIITQTRSRMRTDTRSVMCI